MRPDDPPAPTLALVAAVALHAVAAPLAPNVQIKWPNDLVANGAKLAGILLEREEDRVVLGFGMNLAHHPHDLERPATSVAALAGVAPQPDACVEVLADAFARWLERWRSGGVYAIRSAWLERAHAVGSALRTSLGEGLFDGLDEQGGLRLRLPDGSVRLIHAGDVFLV